jgi:hypothetical protein
MVCGSKKSSCLIRWVGTVGTLRGLQALAHSLLMTARLGRLEPVTND